MASTGFKAIAQVAEILDRPEIDGTARHFIMDLLTKTLGENNQLKTSLEEKNQEICDLRFDSRGYEDHNKLLVNENESLATSIHERNQTIESLGNQLREKDEEIEDLQAKIQEQDDNAERALGETAEVIEQLEEEIKMINESRQKVKKQLTEKEKETEKHKQTIESLRGQMREKKIREKLSEIMMTEKDEMESEEEGSEEEDSEEEEDVEEEPRRRYVAPTVDDPFVPVMENGIKKWYRRSKCCGSYSWGGEELWVRNWM